ncbi:efflux RND transporter periplasmic adaptor subunit [Thermoproteota archaeon]
MRALRSKNFIIFAAISVIALISLVSCSNKDQGVAQQESNEIIEYYTCGMHPSVRVSPQEYNKGSVNCPICNMGLTPVYKSSEAKGSATQEDKGSKGSMKGSHIDEPKGSMANMLESDATVGKEGVYYGCGVDTDGKCPHCDLGKPDGNCICGEHLFAVEGQKINCPVCSQPLRELTQEESDRLKNVVSRVKVKGEQARLAGVKTEPIRKLHLFKNIRTAGKVAYDPRLAIAQEEFISGLNALDKIQGGDIVEIKERSERLVESSKRKLMLLGLSLEQIEGLKASREIQSSLVLPEKKMWIYGDVYEYEMNWVKVGAAVKVTTDSSPGEIFKGIVSSVNPVVDPKTRSIRFRAEVDNSNLKLKPEMYVDITIQSMYTNNLVLAIPKDAVLDTGVRKMVWIDKGDGEYEGRDIIIGPAAVGIIDGNEIRVYPVLRGLSEGEQVVTKANFLIDSQSQISGVASSAYGGALGAEEQRNPMKGSHAGH